MSRTSAAETYRRNAILTASPEKLVKMLYEGAIRHLERIQAALSDSKSSHSADVGESVGKALGIIGELRAALDHEQGAEVAQNLDSLYEYCLDQITEANLERKPQPVANCLQVLRTLKEGWDAVIPQ